MDVRTVAAHYGDLLNGYIIDEADDSLASELDLPILVTPTLMRSLADREALARAVLDFADRLRIAPTRRASGGGR